MLHDSITLLQGSSINNMVTASGTIFPVTPDAGELFFRLDSNKLFVYDGADWAEITSGSVASVVSVAGRTGVITLSTTDVSGLSVVAASGAYADLSGTPGLSTVALSGSYNDLLNLPLASAAAAGTLTGSTLAVGVTASSLTSVGTLSSLVVTGNITTGGVSVGFKEILQNAQASGYTLALTDSNKHIYNSSVAVVTFTIPANASVAFPIGSAITFVNPPGGGAVTIAINSDTMILAGAGTTGSRTLAANGIATAIKITATSWMISGVNLT